MEAWCGAQGHEGGGFGAGMVLYVAARHDQLLVAVKCSV